MLDGEGIESCSDSAEQEPREVEPWTKTVGFETALEIETLGSATLNISDGTPVRVYNLSRG